MKMFFSSRSAARSFVAKARVANPNYRVQDAGSAAANRWSVPVFAKKAPVLSSAEVAKLSAALAA